MDLAVELTCREAWKEISEFVDQNLDREMQDRMRLHLIHCAHCKAVYDGVRNTVQLIAGDRVYDLPPGFSERIRHRLWVEFGVR